MPAWKLFAISQANLRTGAHVSESKRKDFGASAMHRSLEARFPPPALTNFSGTLHDMRSVGAATRRCRNLPRDATDLPHLLTLRPRRDMRFALHGTAVARRTPWRLFALEAMMSKTAMTKTLPMTESRACVSLVWPAMQMKGS